MRFLCFLLLLFYADYTLGQDYKLAKSIAIDEPTEVSLDQAGNIYFATYRGDIIRFDPLLENRLVFSPTNPNTATILEAWQGLRVFSFHRDLQQYRLINRNLSLHEDYSFPQELISFTEIATPSYDNNIWLIDQGDFSLIKFDITTRRLRSRTPLDQLLNPDNYEILFCKEYQNNLFISTREHGILIFDNLGTYIKTYLHEGISFFNFWKDNLYFLEENKLVQINLYNEKIIVRDLPGTSYWDFILIYEDRTYLFSHNQLKLYK